MTGAHALLGLAGDPDRGEFTGTVEPRRRSGIIPVVLALHARPPGDERGRDHRAGIPPLAHRSVQDIAGPDRFIAAPEFPVSRKPVEKPLEFDEVIHEPFDAGRARGAGREDGDRNRVLVHVHADIDDRGRSSRGSNGR